MHIYLHNTIVCFYVYKSRPNDLNFQKKRKLFMEKKSKDHVDTKSTKLIEAKKNILIQFFKNDNMSFPASKPQ